MTPSDDQTLKDTAEADSSAGVSCAAPAGSPLCVSFSLSEIEDRLKQWMIAEFGHPRDYLTEPDQKDKWYRDYGLIYHFIRDQFPANKESPHQKCG